MDDKGAAMKTDNSRSRGTESERTQRDAVFELGYHAAKDNAQFSVTDSQSVGDIALKEAPKHFDNPSTEVNMEATIDPEDVIRAGGIGARDDISSLLPIASDSTDFEASLLDAREYEEPQGELRRPGLGWMEDRVAE